MNTYNTYEDNRFKTISEFKECIIRGGEVEFTWNGINYSVTSSGDKISISQFYSQDTERLCDSPDEALEYVVGEDRLRDVITQVTVIERTI